MAFNARRPVMAEKHIVGKIKQDVKDQAKTKRPPLGEINNQIIGRQAVAKKVPVTKKPELKPINLAPKESKKVVVRAPKLDLPKNTAVITKTVTECKIKEITEPKSFSTKRFDTLEEIIGKDPQFVAEYINDIFAHLHNLEEKYEIRSNFLQAHKTTKRMRTILINWLVDVQLNFKFLSETLHLCVAVVDRYLQVTKSIGRENLQLVGISALWIAGKYEEMYIPELDDFSYICDDSFSTEQIRKMELSIMKTLDFSFGRPLSLHFLRRYSQIVNAQAQVHNMAKYFLELALMEYDLCHIKPSLQAAAAMYLALSAFHGENGSNKIWTKSLVHYSSYTFTDIEGIVKLIAASVVKAETSKFQAIRNKYASSANGKISLCAELKSPIVKKLAAI